MKLHNRSTVHSRLKTIVFIFLSLMTFYVAAGQNVRKEAPSLRERLFFGGSFGMEFGTYTDIEVSPVIGFWLRPRLAVAVGPDYTFYKDPSNRTDLYGGHAYMQFVFIHDLNSLIPIGLHYGFFLQAEDDLLSLQSSAWKNPPYSSTRFFVNTPFAGAGISQPMGRRSSLNLTVLWALADPEYDIYGNPEIRISLIF